MSTQSTLDASRDGLLSLPEATSHQLSKRQQYDALLIAEAGPSSNAATSPAAPASHPSFPAVASLCRQYPTQASAVFQAYLDLKNGAAAWDIVEPLVLSSNSQQGSTTETESAGRDLSSLSDAEAAEMVQEKLAHLKSGIARLGLVNDVPAEKAEEERDELFETGLAAIKGRRKDAKAYEIVIPLNIAQHLRASQLHAIFNLINVHAATSPPGEEINTSHVLLAIIAPDSTLVYYLISQGMVKPIN